MNYENLIKELLNNKGYSEEKRIIDLDHFKFYILYTASFYIYIHRDEKIVIAKYPTKIVVYHHIRSNTEYFNGQLEDPIFWDKLINLIP